MLREKIEQYIDELRETCDELKESSDEGTRTILNAVVKDLQLVLDTTKDA